MEDLLRTPGPNIPSDPQSSYFSREEATAILRGRGLRQIDERGLRALVDRLTWKVLELSKLDCSLQDKRDRCTELLSGCSGQLELLHTAHYRLYNLGENFPSPELCNRLMSLGTYLGEALHVKGSRYVGRGSDPIDRTKFVVQLMRMELGLSTSLEAYFGPEHEGCVIPSQFEYDFREYDGGRIAADPKLLSQLEQVCSELVIDRELKKPQLGFGRMIPAEELERNLSARPGGRQIVIYVGDFPVGAYQIAVGREAVPAHVVDAIRKAEFAEQHALSDVDSGAHNFPSHFDAWVDLVFISKAARDEFSRKGTSLYEELSEAISDTARGLGVYRLWGEVRRGVQANTAYDTHLKQGRIATGVVTQHDGSPYEILLFHPFAAGEVADDEWLFSYGCFSNDKLEEYEALTSIYRDFEFVSAVHPLVPDFDETRIADLVALENQIGRAFACGVKELSVAKNHMGCIEIQFTMDRYYRTYTTLLVQQKVPGKDLWKLEEPGYYILGIDEPMRTFDQLYSPPTELPA